MERPGPDFDEQDSGAPVTWPGRNPDPLGPQHSVEPGTGGGSVQGAGNPAKAVRDESTSELDRDRDEEPSRRVEGEKAVPDRQSGLSESNPAEGL